MNHQKKNIPGIMVAAVKSGSGKTMITCALLEAFKQKGLKPRAFKCGPDFIDPMFHQEIIGVPSRNLDTFFSDEQQVRELFLEDVGESKITVVEGVMGLFDGLLGIREEGSAYHLASVLKMPILLVVDAHGMGRSILPLLAGFLQYDKEKRICGVILNRTTDSFYRTIAPLIEQELKISVFGFFPERKDLKIESRHLGLRLPGEIDDLRKQTRQAAEILKEHVSLDKILIAAEQKQPFAENKRKTVSAAGCKVKVGIAKDAAFCFYYEDNLRLLREMGAELIPFSPLRDRKLPEGISGIILGGGYPELYGAELEANDVMRKEIKYALEHGMPSLAECGGFMYLHNELVDEKGDSYRMCGVLPEKCFYTGKLVRFGYVEVREDKACFLKEKESIRGHEFHYYDSEKNGADCIATKPTTGKNWNCVHETEKSFWGFPHLYYPSNPDFAEHFLKVARQYKKR